MLNQHNFSSRWLLLLPLLLFACFVLATSAKAQNTVTGAFEGTVTNSRTGARIEAASVQIINQANGIMVRRRTDAQGRFYQGLLPPGIYTIRISASGFKTEEKEQLLFTTQPNQVVPIPVSLEPENAIAMLRTASPAPQPQPTPAPSSTPAVMPIENRDVRAETNITDARRAGAFAEKEVSTLPLGAITLVRSFDELAMLLPGVTLPPQTLGSVAGPGVGAGVGSAGQFAVNGLRSRANNFTVDGSDNNDEDIGVRRQGFLSLIPQPIESIKEYQVITLLAPAQFGRNIGAQVNAVSKSGGNETHGTFYGLFNSSQLNAGDFFDTASSNTISPLRSVRGQSVIVAPDSELVISTPPYGKFVPINGRPLTVRNDSGGKDSFTLSQGGFVLGGALAPERMFYFISAEGQLLHATKEESFAVPTLEQRGAFNTATSGTFLDPFEKVPAFAFPTSFEGDAIFSLFPFPNNPTGVYGANTLTQVLPASAQGKVLSGKLDGNFKVRERQQSFTARYNFTDDFRDIPMTGGAIFSTLRPRVRTQNLSTFLNSEVTDPDSTRPIFNQVRLSYGRTRLVFNERRNTEFLVPSSFPDTPFLLNAPVLSNYTLPDFVGGQLVPNNGPVLFRTFPSTDPQHVVEGVLGPVGQVVIAGFSPVGVDVFNFPQRRVNNTYQLADILTLRARGHSYAFGMDHRRTELNSDLPRNSRPLITFNGAPRLRTTAQGMPTFSGFYNPLDLAATSAPSGFFQTIATSDSNINLRYYQLNFFAQDEWRVRRNLSLSYGLRYEYNTPPREVNRRIERTFNSPDLNLIPGLSRFIDNRRRIFDSDCNNLAPRLFVAYSPNLFGSHLATVIRFGGGLFYDQILGAVVSQSRNVFPNFLTVNGAGGFTLADPNNPHRPAGSFNLINPNFFFAQKGTLNRLGLNLAEAVALTSFLNYHPDFQNLPPVSGFSITLPARQLKTPMAYHYAFTFEQQLGLNVVVSAAYVGTQGRHLLRHTTPNLGPNAFLLPARFGAAEPSDPDGPVPTFFGIVLAPGMRITSAGDFVGGRPLSQVGAVNIFETSANSRYDALQLQIRGRFFETLQYQAGYTFSKVIDDVSDVFDLAGAPALPQNSLTRAGERGPANFDVRHRFSYNFIYGLPTLRNRSRTSRFLFGGLQIAGTGQFQTGQPFTVNSISDVNLDGNLTDRLNTTNGIMRTGDRRQPLRLTVDPTTLLAPIGHDGGVRRNIFRSSNLLLFNLALVKNFAINERQTLTFRTEIFNLTNRANFGIPVRYLEAPGFGQATNTVTPGRRIQISLKYSF